MKSNLNGVCALLAACSVVAPLACGADEGTTKNDLRVLKVGERVFIRNPFSADKDLVVRMGLGTNRQINFAGALFVDSSTPMTEKDLNGGRVIHNNSDDSTPWNLNGTYIGGNHGCSDGRELTVQTHGRTTADLGSEWEDAQGHKFYLVRIVNADKLWFLSENTGKGGIWKFNTTYAGNTLANKSLGVVLTFTDNRMAQLCPACRIGKQDYLADGKAPLADGKVVSCGWLDIVEDYDIINPGSLLADIISHPGAERSFTGDSLEAVVRNQIVYRFHPNGANVIYTTSTALQEFQIGYMGFIQSGVLNKGEYESYEYYIPKTTPFVKDNIHYNFQSVQDFSFDLPSALRFSAGEKNIEDLNNLPERFIQFLGRKDGERSIREVGYALGYSLIYGMTVPLARAKNASQALMLPPTKKSYPVALDVKEGTLVSAGAEFYCVAYRQYFSIPPGSKATCVYWHKEGTDTVVYADYHKAVDHDVMKLPSELAGRKITVVEKTPSLTLHTDATVLADGVQVSVDGNCGYIVFKVDGRTPS